MEAVRRLEEMFLAVPLADPSRFHRHNILFNLNDVVGSSETIMPPYQGHPKSGTDCRHFRDHLDRIRLRRYHHS
jgi:hypothetical protein